MLVLVVAGEVDVQQARVLKVGWKGDREQALLLPGVRHLIGDVEGWFVERPAVPDDPDPSRPLDDEVGAGRLRDVVRLVELADLRPAPPLAGRAAAPEWASSPAGCARPVAAPPPSPHPASASVVSTSASASRRATPQLRPRAAPAGSAAGAGCRSTVRRASGTRARARRSGPGRCSDRHRAHIPWRVESVSGSGGRSATRSTSLSKKPSNPAGEITSRTGLPARVPEGVPLVARLEDQVSRAADQDLVPEQRSHLAFEDEAVLVLAAVPVKGRREPPGRHRVLHERESAAAVLPVDHEPDPDRPDAAGLSSSGPRTLAF